KSFEDCVQMFEINKSQVSTPAHFMKIYTQQLTANRKRREQQAKERRTNMAFGKPMKSLIPSMDLFKKMTDPNA
ncbi:Replicase RepFR55, partial [Bacillus toyonensis]